MDYRFRDSLSYHLNKVTNAIRYQFNKYLKSFEITGEQFAIMKIIQEHANLSQNQIAKIISKDKTTIARAIDLLEKKKLISKKRSADDRRTYLIEINESGRQILSQAIPIAIRYNKIIKDRISDKDEEAFLRVLNIMLDASKNLSQKEQG
ncbi:MAG: hypothetical protein IEMM0003_0897 [bacterium]|nr:MAG: hypothetical protein IEMM0003_0897 [bacterium]